MKGTARTRLAQRVRLLRANRGWSQEVLGELAGLNRSYIGAIERAEHNIGLDNMERIALALEITLSFLLDTTKIIEHRFAQPQESELMQIYCPPVVIHRQTFLALLQQCGQNHRELILIYLERCGVTIKD